MLIAVYGCTWALIALAGAFMFNSAPTAGRESVPLLFYSVFALAVGGVMAPSLLVLAVFLWRGSIVAVILSLVLAICLALPLLAILGVGAINMALRPDLIDWHNDLGMLAGSLGVLLAGPGIVVALLFAPSSRRVWAPPSVPAGEATSPTYRA